MPNLLPHGGIVNYYGKVFTASQARIYFDLLLNTIEWKHDEVIIFGKHIVTKRKVAWYGEKGCAYTYSNLLRQPIPWTNELLKLKENIEHIAGTSFNSCLLNLYQSGAEGMSWHSDDEKELGKHNTIASVSLGAERRFLFKHKKTKENVSLILEDGSLLIMKSDTQENWLHALPKSKKIIEPRINLTFRTIKQSH